MRKLFLSIAAVAALLVTGSFTQRAEAVMIGSPAGMLGAVEDLATIENVHCRPGRRHHYPTRWRRADGCARRGVIIVRPGFRHYRYGSRGHYRYGSYRRWRY